jgi:hypothetical protein
VGPDPAEGLVAMSNWDVDHLGQLKRQRGPSGGSAEVTAARPNRPCAWPSPP